jgi:protein TonB
MTARRDILDERDAMRRPLTGSLLLHVAVFLSAAAYNWLEGRPRETLGDPNALGGISTVITPVAKIPLPPKSGMVNPVANDTESQAPSPPKPEKKSLQDDRNAIELAIKKKQDEAKKKKQPAAKKNYQDPLAERRNQVFTETGRQAVSEMYDQSSSGNGVGMAHSNPFGNRFGYYANIVRERVAQSWKPNQLDPRMRSAPVILTFSIYRDGRAGDIRVQQSSGVSTLDYSAQRAILEASPFHHFHPALSGTRQPLNFNSN